MKSIAPDFFYNCLVTALANCREDLAARWDNTPAYTEFIKSKVLPEVGKLIDLECHARDYWTLDCIYYEDYDTENFPKGAYAKYIAVALEHENDLRTSCEEMNKLQLINSPLKVLITYANPRLTKKFLLRYRDIIKKADIFQEDAGLRRQLVVFGEKPKSESFPLWRGFVYEHGDFREIFS